MFDVKKSFLSLILAGFVGTSVLASSDDKVDVIMQRQVALLFLISLTDSLALQTYRKIYDPATYDRVIAKLIKEIRGDQSLSDFANEIGVSRDQLIASEQTGKGLTNELLEKIWQTGTPPTVDKINALQQREAIVGISRSEFIVYRETYEYTRETIRLLIRLQEDSKTKDGIKPTVSQIMDNVKMNYGRLLVFAKEKEISVDKLIGKERIDDKLISELQRTVDNANAFSSHVGRTFLANKISELEANTQETPASNL